MKMIFTSNDSIVSSYQKGWETAVKIFDEVILSSTEPGFQKEIYKKVHYTGIYAISPAFSDKQENKSKAIEY